MRSLLLVCFVFAVAVFAAPTPAPSPSKPSWPPAFSASVMLTDDANGQNRFFRWFYSQTLNKDRFDGTGMWNNELYFITQIFDHVANQQYDVFSQLELTSCFSHSINGTIPKPNLAQMTFLGKAMIGYQPAYQWVYEQVGTVNVTWSYFDSQTTREPLRIDVSAENQAATWIFWEFDDDSQDPSLYSLPTAVLAQCNAV